ncbi:MAG: hypothetical protein M5R36_13420 [Deltaproteobacteria bacterium]|nr:hypothetical protein [Deltaproteobacteria bacterium]
MARRNEMIEHLNGPQKAAALLMFLGEEISAQVMKNLDDDEIHRVVKTIATMGDISPERMDNVLDEFNDRVIKEGYMAEVGKDFVEKVVHKALPAGRAGEFLGRLSYVEKLEDLKNTIRARFTTSSARSIRRSSRLFCRTCRRRKRPTSSCACRKTCSTR